jgi:hypothetical protein
MINQQICVMSINQAYKSLAKMRRLDFSNFNTPMIFEKLLQDLMNRPKVHRKIREWREAYDDPVLCCACG